MNKWVRIFVIGFIWGWIFLGWLVNHFLIENWNFHFFEWNHWLFLWSEFQQGWNIDDKGTVIFFIVLFSALPLYLIGWRFFLKVEWLKLLRRNVNRLIYFLTGYSHIFTHNDYHIKLKKQSSKTIRPRPLESSYHPEVKESELKVPVDAPSLPKKQPPAYDIDFDDDDENDFMFSPTYQRKKPYSPPDDSPFTKGYTVPSMMQGLSVAPNPSADRSHNSSIENVLLEDIKLPERIKLEENISELMMRAGYQVIEKARFNETVIDYLGMSADKIILAIADTQPGDWLADEERFNGEDPLWFSESSHRVSPVFQLVEMAKGFAKKLSSVGYSGSVLPLFIVRKGTIINAEDMISTWKEMSVTVCRTDIGGPDELKTVTQSIEQVMPPTNDVISAVQAVLQGGL